MLACSTTSILRSIPCKVLQPRFVSYFSARCSLLFSPDGVRTKVNNTFEVKGAGGGGKVFALGDCADIPVPKMAYLAGAQGSVVAKQVAVSAGGKPLKDAMVAPLAVSLVPVGKSGGVSLLPMGIVVGDCITRIMKSRDLFVSKFWAEMNAGKPPPMA